MKLHIAVVVVLLGACDKPNDAPRLQDEITATAKLYRKRYDALSDRIDAIGKRGDALGKGAESGEAYKEFHEAKSIVEEQRHRIDGLAQQAQTAAKTGNPEELQKILDENTHILEEDLTKATWEADAAESWLAQVEQGGEPPAPSPEPPPTETPSTTGTGPQPGTTGADVPSGTANPPTTGAQPPAPVGSGATH